MTFNTFDVISCSINEGDLIVHMEANDQRFVPQCFVFDVDPIPCDCLAWIQMLEKIK